MIWKSFLLLLPLGSPVVALEIRGTLGSDSAAPGFDPDASQLQAVFDEASAYWEDIIEDTATVRITFRYKDINALASGGALLVSNGKPFSGSISIDSTPRSWYFDADPSGHSEFALEQRTYQDYSSNQQSAWFNGAPPELLEVSFAGPATQSAPSMAQQGFDMYTILLHEIGHVLGLSHAQLAGAETIDQGDYDFDFDPAWIGGVNAAVKTDGTNPNNVDDWSHLASASLMCNACARTGERVLPSATDVFAVASAAGWTHSLATLH